MFWIRLITDVIDLAICCGLLYLGSRIFSSIRLSLQQSSIRLFMASAAFFFLHEGFSVAPAQGEWVEILQELLQTGFIGCLCAAMWFIVRSQKSEIQGLQQLAETDALTGLENLTAFRRLALQVLKREKEERAAALPPVSSASGPVPAVLMIDIDQFKSYNDSFGHEAGNVALQSVARSLRQAARQSDLVARYGGEEFVCLMLLPRPMAQAAAERLRAAVEAECDPARNLLLHRQLTVSVGLAVSEAESAPAEEALDALVNIADHELYRAKKAGRNRVCSSLDTEPKPEE